MKPIRILITLMCCVSVCVPCLKAQNEADIKSRLFQFARNAVLFNTQYTQEKVYLHFDNTGYFLGEDLWFKAYVINASTGAPTDMSKTLYVELLTPEGDIVNSKKLRLNNGVCSSGFHLADSLPGGYYEVRAYTRCMLNFDKEVLFSRVFPVYSAPIDEGNYQERIMVPRQYYVPELREKSPGLKKINLAFYPEGGQLVQGLKTTVAFKATDQDGKNLTVTGIVTDKKNQTITSFSSLHDGMGIFTLTPDNAPCQAIVQFDGKAYTNPLPEAMPSGYVMNVTSQPSDDSLRLQITRTPDLPETDTLALAITCRGKLTDLQLITVPLTGKQLSLSKKELTTGVNQCTLYDVNGNICSERLVFVSPLKVNRKQAVAYLTAETDKAAYKAYEPVTVNLFASSNDVLTYGSSLSLSVRDAVTSDFGNSDNRDILTDLLMASDLKGYIKNPGWYFSDTTDVREKALDLLMLTQGWRRYDWKQMEGLEPFEAKHPIEEGIVIDGRILSLVLKKPKANIDLTVWMTRGNYSMQSTAVTDTAGSFRFLLDEFYDIWDLNIRTSIENKNKDYRVILNREFSPEPRFLTAYEQEVWKENQNETDQVETTAANTPDSLPEEEQDIDYTIELNPTNKEGWKEYRLKEVVKTADRKLTVLQDVQRRASVSFNWNKKRDEIIDKQKILFGETSLFLNEVLPLFSITSDPKAKYPYRYKGRPVIFKTYFNDNETEMGSTDIFNEGAARSTGTAPDLTGFQIDKVMVLEDYESLAKIAPEALSNTDFIALPVVICTVMQRKKIKPKEPIGVRQTTFTGYSQSPTFFSPVYPEGEPVLDPDYRRTLYWNPDIILDKNGRASIRFFNNETCNKINISAEGITGNGTLLKNK